MKEIIDGDMRQKVEELIRDITRIGFMAKSEVHERIMNLLGQAYDKGYFEGRKETEKYYDESEIIYCNICRTTFPHILCACPCHSDLSQNRIGIVNALDVTYVKGKEEGQKEGFRLASKMHKDLHNQLVKERKEFIKALEGLRMEQEEVIWTGAGFPTGTVLERSGYNQAVSEVNLAIDKIIKSK